jgi:dipeptidyl aminopeptidase/acylaminoacyl peptidase
MRIRINYSGAQAPLSRLWVRLAREGRQVEPVAYEISANDGSAPAGTVSRSFEMGEPGPRHLTVVAEDSRGVKSAPLEMQFEVVTPPRQYEELTYLSEGLKIKAYLYRPAGQGPFPAIIYSRGSKSAPREVAPAARFEWLGYRLARSGYVVLVAERRGYGGSEGQSVEIGETLSTRRWSVRSEVKDVLSAIDFLKGQPEVDSKRIALLGKSLGGAVSLLAAADRPELRAVVSMAGGLGASEGPGLLYVQEELLGAARRIRAPTLLMHAENDRIVPVQYSRQITDELERQGTRVATKIYPPFKVGGQEIEGHRLFDRVDGLAVFWKDLTDFLAGALTP